MNLQKSQDRINELISRFVAQVKGAKAMRRTDINSVSEDVLIPLFSEVFGHTDLKNLNVSEEPNFPAIDLGDEKTKTAYQITSKFHTEKIKNTIRKFVDHKLYEKFDRLVIYILTEKPETYHGKGLDDIIQDKFSFDKDTDILDYRDLLEEISGFPLDKSRRVEEILEQQFGDESNLNQESTNPLDWLAQVNDSWVEDSATFKINREKLLNELLNFASGGHGVIIGQPGIGKSYLLKDLHHSLDSANRPHLLLLIDELGTDIPETLSQVLSDDETLIKRLKSVPTSCQKSILLFDAFDAARDEKTRNDFLNLIHRAINDLSESWNVVVTVRTYDATKSLELLDMFGNSDNTKYRNEEVLCRNFEIPPLEPAEIEQTFGQIQSLEAIYNRGSKEFKHLLAIPFNLWLLQKIIMSSMTPPDFSEIYSEVQLLDMFWQRRIKNTCNELDRESVLEQVARHMVEGRSLSVRRGDIYERANLVEPAKQTAWNNLLSDEILANVSSTGQRVAFSHNILFDYAISVLLIEDDSQRLEDFILEDESRPLFLRPSLTYFFTRLWYNAPKTFWSIFWHVFQSEQSEHLRLVVRLIPTRTIVSESRQIGQLTPYLDQLERKEEIANGALKWLLQSLRALEIQRDPLWSDFFARISAYLHSDFAWDLAILVSKILDRVQKTETSTIKACGKVGRRLLKWTWKEGQVSENDWYYRLASSWAVPLVAKTYGTSPKESRGLLEKVIELTLEDNLKLDLLTQLAEHVDKIWGLDPDFIISTYVSAFGHQEVGDVMTNPMGGRIRPVASANHQDYSMCHYWLAEHFPSFLREKPIAATKAVIRSLNFYIIHNQILSYRQEAIELQDMMESFEFQGKTAYLLPDNSCAWDKREILDEPIKMADALFEYISELVKSEESPELFDSLLDVFRDEVRVSFFWKRLLNTGILFPEVFDPHLFELCTAKPILMSRDAQYELGEFLRVATSVFAPGQRRLMEQTILDLLGEVGEHKEFLEYLTNQYLAQIPSTLLVTSEAKKIRSEMERDNSVPENRPPVSYGPVTWGRYTDEEWLQEQGVDVTTSENKELQRFFEPFEEFCSNWLNKAPTREATELILPLLQEAYTAIKSDTEADKEVRDLLWYKVTACAAILARVVDDSDSHQFNSCRDVLLDAAKHELPTSHSYQDAQFDCSTYSPFPRHEAASGLLRLTARQSSPDSEILGVIESLANDPVPSVRMVTATELILVFAKTPKRFWKIVEARTTQETNYAVLEWLCVTLTQVVRRGKDEEDKTIRAMDKMFKHSLTHREKLTLPDQLIELSMRLIISRENSWVRNTINDILLKNPTQYAHSLNHAVFWVMNEYVAPMKLATPNGRKTAKRAIAWLGEVITAASREIEQLRAESKASGARRCINGFRDVYKLIDEVIRRLYLLVATSGNLSEERVEGISFELHRGFYNEVQPLMKQVIDLALDEENGVMSARTAYYFMRLLTTFRRCHTKEVLHFAVGVAKASERFGYSLDSLAVDDAVKFAETILADYRHEVREGQALENLLNLLAILAKAGSSDALRLVWRLDEVFR